MDFEFGKDSWKILIINNIVEFAPNGIHNDIGISTNIDDRESRIRIYWHKKVISTLLTDIIDNSQIKNKEKWLVFEQKCSKLNLIELRGRDDFGQTLLHFSAGLDNTDLLNVLLTVDGDLTKYTNKLGESAGDEGLKHGQWSVVKYNV